MSNASDFIIENGVLTKYVGPGGDVVVPDSVTKINFNAFSGLASISSITLPEGIESFIDLAYYGLGYCGLRKVILPESLSSVGYKMFGDDSQVEFIGSTNSEKIQNEKNPTIVCSDELLKVLWEGISAQWKRNIGFYQLQRQGLAGEKMAPVVKSYVTKNKKAVLEMILEADHAAAMDSFLTVGKKPTLDIIDGYLVGAQGKKELTAFLLKYKAEHFSQGEVENYETSQVEKNLGFRELSVVEWRKIFTFKTENSIAKISGYKGSETDVIVPAQIGKNDVVLGESAFADNEIVERISVMASGKTIEKCCFSGCKKVKEVMIPDGVTKIGECAFYGCSTLTKIKLPAQLKEIGSSAFAWCKGLTTITIPDGVTTIGDGAFRGCESLIDITISDNVKSIGEEAGWGCKNLADQTGLVIVNDILFDCISEEEVIHIPDGVTTIGKDAFTFSKAKSVILPESVTTIEKEAFCNVRLEKIWIPASVKKIRAKAFYSLGRILPNLVIHTSAGSAAEKYAKKYNIPFVVE